MSLSLIPQPREIEESKSAYQIPNSATIGISDSSLYELAKEAGRAIFRRFKIAAIASEKSDDFYLGIDESLKAGGYRLIVHDEGVRLIAQNPTAAWHGLQTLLQIAGQSPKGCVAKVAIDDWPEFQDRGLYYDVCRGRVPTLASLKDQARLLAHFKINHLQYYVKHTFVFRDHPEIGRNCGSLTAEEIMEVDACCRENHIDFVPSIASFGHMDRILEHAPYRHLAEDKGVGEYHEELKGHWVHAIRKGWTITPGRQESYDFIDSLWSEFLPLFQSKRFNVCCDETWDLGMGQSYELCQKKGKGRVYLEHILRLRDLAAKYGKQIMFWGDIIHHYPELIPELPDDITVLDWGYEHSHNYENIKRFKKVGVPFLACPGTSSWSRLFPENHNARVNIEGWTQAARKNGADGILNTDWGDGGHYNLMEFSWPGYLYAAEQAWNPDADKESFNQRFVKVFLNSDSKPLAKGLDELGKISCRYLRNAYFATPDADLFQESPKRRVFEPDSSSKEVILNARYLKSAKGKLQKLRETIQQEKAQRQSDPHRILPAWSFSVDTLDHAIEKCLTFGPRGEDTAEKRKELRREMQALQRRFEKLWMNRNKKSEIRVTLNYYKKAIEGLK